MRFYELFLGEGHGGGFFSEYWSILSDPAHVAAELTMLLLEMLIISPILYFIARKARDGFRKSLQKKIEIEHEKIDVEHGYSHGNAGHNNTIN